MLRLYANTSEAFLSRHQGFCTQTCASFSQGKKQWGGFPQHWLSLGRWRRTIKSMTVNVSGLKQQFPNSLCSGTIDMTAGVLWGLLQLCSSVDLPWDVTWGSAGRTTHSSHRAECLCHSVATVTSGTGLARKPPSFFMFYSLVLVLQC